MDRHEFVQLTCKEWPLLFSYNPPYRDQKEIESLQIDHHPSHHVIRLQEYNTTFPNYQIQEK